jgi:serine/threonine protein kinase
MSSELSVGTLLRERYQVVSLIGQGGMGAVYLTDDVRLPGRRCAVKEIRLPPGLSPVGEGTSEAERLAREQFHREASTLARLDHPNLPKVSDFFSVGDRDYLVMDYVPGVDLLEVVREARRKGRFLPEPQPVLHRDVKPATVKLTPHGDIKLVDFGLVKPIDLDRDSTFTGLRGMGSVPYTPLEQYGEIADHTDVRSDIYALGATLYHLLTGNEPPSAQEILVRPDILVPPRRINADISTTAEGAILAAMATHPSGRPPTVEVWQRLLRPEGQPVRVGQPASPRRSPWARVWRENGWLIVLCVLLSALVLYLAFR